MTWINTDYRFSLHAATLVLSRRAALVHGLESLMAAESPTEILDAATVIIKKYRPDLAGGVLEAMRFNIESNDWEFRYSHESLPVNHEGCCADRIQLIPYEEKHEP